MAQGNEDRDRKPVPCCQCGREVPVSEAKVAEAVDYVLYFCGLDCYESWATQSERPGCFPRKD